MLPDFAASYRILSQAWAAAAISNGSSWDPGACRLCGSAVPSKINSLVMAQAAMPLKSRKSHLELLPPLGAGLIVRLHC
jgi:hypothetical protein